MGRYSDAVAKLKECEEAYYQTDTDVGALTDDEFEAFKDLLKIAKQIHDKARANGGTRKVIKRLEDFRLVIKEPKEAGDESEA